MENTQIRLSRGVYALLKENLKSKKISDYTRQRLAEELQSAQILSGKDLPRNVVAVNTKVQIKDKETAQELAFELVGPADAKLKTNKLSVLSPIGLALVGYAEGDEVRWEMPEGPKTYKIEKVLTN